MGSNYLINSLLPSATAKVIFVSTLILFVSAKAVDLPANVTVPAVFAFGDSIVDTGNNNHIFTVSRCDFPPYGRDFASGKPTGRFSNGRVPSDMIAEVFGVKKLLPPYLDPHLQIQDLLTGVSFASGAAGYDSQTSKVLNVLSPSDQLDLYNKSITRIKEAVGDEKASWIVSQSIYIVCLGSNDITNTFFGPFNLHHNISSYTDHMIKWTSTFIQGLYKLGARRIGVIGLPPTGCVPAIRTLRGGLRRKCSYDVNNANSLFNSKLASLADLLSFKLSGSKVIYLDIYNTLLSLIQNASQYGFEVSNRGCCGTGNLEVSFLCNRLDDLMTCKDDETDKFVFWDSFHPTEKAYKIIIDQTFDEDNVKKFF